MVFLYFLLTAFGVFVLLMALGAVFGAAIGVAELAVVVALSIGVPCFLIFAGRHGWWLRRNTRENSPLGQ